MSGRGSGRGRLGRLGALAPAALVACVDASVLAAPAAGAVVSTLLAQLSRAFMLKKWFHGGLSAKEAEQLMMQKGKNGSFLVRESRGSPGDFVLSVRVRDRVSHVVIRKQDNKFEVGRGEQRFEELAELIEHYRSCPMVESTGDVLRLLQPLSFTQLRLGDLQKKIVGSVGGAEEVECEFEELRALDKSSNFTCVVGNTPENRCKNRYKNIIPYDQTRVVLRGRRAAASGGDYINASYIRVAENPVGDAVAHPSASAESLNSLRPEPTKTTLSVSKSLNDESLTDVRKLLRMDKLKDRPAGATGPVGHKTYIATQGCLPNTEEYFWSMIWQEDVRVIAMITKEIERGKKKCEAYWPAAVGEERAYETCTVSLSSEECRGEHTRRELRLQSTQGASRTVYQYQLTTWDDHGAPASTRPVLNFLRDVNRQLNLVMLAKEKPDNAVLCVHCSAGVGRTGTFIVLDAIIDQIQSKDARSSVDILGTAKKVRSQRAGAVQSREQYRFVRLAVQDYVAGVSGGSCGGGRGAAAADTTTKIVSSEV